jgi:hypothetical protein
MCESYAIIERLNNGTLLGVLTSNNIMKTMKSSFPLLIAAFLLVSCNSETKKQEAALRTKQATIDSMQAVIAKQAVIDSMNNVMADREEKLKEQNEENTRQNVVNNATAPSRSAAATPAKKKWNHTAKGAVVGAGTGAVTGAIINKKRGEGAIIGSLIGAGVGAGTGAVVDASKKKKNRDN